MLMVGMEDGWIALVWWLSIITPLAGVIYGLLNWNSEGRIAKKDSAESEGVSHSD